MANPGTLYKWIERLPEDGRYVFSRADAESVTEASREAVQLTLRRLKRRGAIVSPRRGFYVVVPPEYRSAGCPPATWFIDDLMRHLDRRYYVALLTAASLHGAGHQQPMAFQVIAEAAERHIEVGRVHIDFHLSNHVEDAAKIKMQTEVGSMLVSTPETTAFDMVRFPLASGHWSAIAIVLSELAERLDPLRLAGGAVRVARSDVQRLGWLLDFLEERELADALAHVLQAKRLVATPLSTTRDSSGATLDRRWHVLVNDEVEPDQGLYRSRIHGREPLVFRDGQYNDLQSCRITRYQTPCTLPAQKGARSLRSGARARRP